MRTTARISKTSRRVHRRVIRTSTRAQLAVVLAVLLVAATHGPVLAAGDCPTARSATGPLATLWQQLDKAKLYRCISLSEGRCQRNSHSDTVRKYRELTTIRAGSPPETPQSAFLRLAGSSGFGQYTGSASASLACEANFGAQEALNELMAGETVLGNDLLLKGLRTRFPGTGDPADPDQLTLLRSSAQTLGGALRKVAEEARLRPQSFRTASSVVPDFPFWVENLPLLPNTEGDVVESEMYRLTELVRLNGLASNSVGKRIFFFENDKTDPAGDGTVPEELQEAVDEVKRSAQATYLHTALLTVFQAPDDFSNNNGHELKRQIVDAERVFDDVLSGFNPLRLLGDFVPHQPFENVMVIFDSLAHDAASKEEAALTTQRIYDESQTALANELQAQRQGNLSEIAALTGIALTTVEEDYNLALGTDRQELQAVGRAIAADCRRGVPGACRGAIGLKAESVREADIEVELAGTRVRQIADQMRIEHQRQDAIAHVELNTGYTIGALQLGEGIAEALIRADKPTFTAAGNGAILGTLRGAQTLVKTISEIRVSEINRDASIKNLLLQEATLGIELARAREIVRGREADLAETLAQLDRALRNAWTARENIEGAYFSNPAYRLQADLARENADAAFEAAMVQGFFATKALEYEWAERLSNPVERIDGLLPEPIGDSATYNGILKAESVFASRSAGAASSPSPSLITYRQALQLWDSKMRQLRFPANQTGPQIVLSMRDVILEIDDRDDFKDYIAQHRVPGGNPNAEDLLFEFPVQIGNQLLLPAQPNLKIESIQINLKSRPGTSLRGPGDPGNPALVNLIMGGEAVIRTFFADYPDDDDLLSVDLQSGRNLQDSPFFSQVESSVDGFPIVATPNTQLQGHSPAVSRWTLWIDMETGPNANLDLRNLDDIELKITYRFGRPRTFSF